MDPNATLAELRAAITADDLDRAAELFHALDEWIVSGGFLPEAWTGDLPTRLARWRETI